MKDLLDNVSLFWRKYFTDVPVLDSLLEGAISSVSVSYAKSLAYLLAHSIESAPLTLSERHKLLKLEDYNFINADGYLAYRLEDSDIRYLPFIAPSPNSPNVLELGVDYHVLKGSETVDSVRPYLEDTTSYIFFNEDIRSLDSYRKEPGYILGKYLLNIIDNMFNIESDDSRVSTLAPVYIKDLEGNLVQECAIALFEESTSSIYLDVSTPITGGGEDFLISFKEDGNTPIGDLDTYKATASTFAMQNTHTMAWVLNCDVDTYLLRDKYGYMFSRSSSDSTESYRNYLAGISLLRTGAFTSKNVKAAICLACNVPVFTTSFEEGDRILHVIKSPTVTKVRTTIATYDIPPELTLLPSIEAEAYLVEEVDSEGNVSVISDRTNPAMPFTQSFKFSRLDCMVQDISVKHRKTGSSWWDRGINQSSWVEIPEELMVGESQLRRLIINHVHPNIVGETSLANGVKIPPAAIGDYGISVGDADRNTVAYNLFKDFIQNHFVFVELSESFITRSGGVDNTLFQEIKNELYKNSTPGTLVLLSPSLEADLTDANSDGIPDILQ